MLIGVELPIIEENVKDIDGFQLYKAHEMFRSACERERACSGLGIVSENAKQFLIVRSEILRRLTNIA